MRLRCNILTELLFLIIIYMLMVPIVARFIIPKAHGINALTSLVIALSLPLSLTIPCCIGAPLVYRIVKSRRLGIASFVILSFSVGILLIDAAELFYYTIPWLLLGVRFNFSLFSAAVYSLSLIAMLSLILAIKKDINRVERSISTDIVVIIFLSFIIALAVSMKWPYPYANENDYIRHAFYSYVLAHGRPLIFYAPYIPTLHTIISIPLVVDGFTGSTRYFLYAYWAYRFIQYPLFAVGVYILARELVKNRFLSISAAILSIAIVYSQEGSILPWHTAPKNMITIAYIYASFLLLRLLNESKSREEDIRAKEVILVSILVAIFSFVMNETRSNGLIGYEIGAIYPIITLLAMPQVSIRLRLGDLTALSLPLFYTLISLHKLEGLVASLYLLLLITAYTIIGRRKELIDAILIATIIASTGYILGVIRGIIPYPAKPLMLPSGSIPFMHSLRDKIRFILNGLYTREEILIYIAGIALILIHRKKMDTSIKIVLLLSILSFLMAFTPINQAYRLLKFGYAFTIIIIVYTIAILSRRNMALKVILLLGLLLSIGIHDHFAFKDSRIIRLQERFNIFNYCNNLRELPNATLWNTIVIGYSQGIGWYQGISSYCAGFFTINLWNNGRYNESILRSIYVNLSSEEAYKFIENIVKEPRYVINIIDNRGIELKRWYHGPPRNIIILYDTILARWLGDPYSVYKFMDPRYYNTISIEVNKEKEKFYIFSLREKISKPEIHIYCNVDCTDRLVAKNVHNCRIIGGFINCNKVSMGEAFMLNKTIYLEKGRYLMKVLVEGKGKAYLSVVINTGKKWIGGMCTMPVRADNSYREENCVLSINKSARVALNVFIPSGQQGVRLSIKSLIFIKLPTNGA